MDEFIRQERLDYWISIQAQNDELSAENQRLREALEQAHALAKTMRSAKQRMGPFKYQERPRELGAWTEARYISGRELYAITRSALQPQPAQKESGE